MIHTGYFFITDITGYTVFLTASELSHAKEILDSLFKVMLDHVRPPLKILGTQGDALITYAPADAFKQAQTLIDNMETIYFEFHHQLQRMKLNTTCTCRACANMTLLDLKVFLHYGEYMEQSIGERTEIQGADVILIHRLMKNTVKADLGLSGYGLITRAAIDAMQADALVGDMTERSETYEHIGPVAHYIHNLPYAWQAEREKRRIRVAEDEALFTLSVDLPVSPLVVWDYITDKTTKTEFLGMSYIERTDDQTGRVGVGSSFHCAHAEVDLYYGVLDWNPPQYLTVRYDVAGVEYTETQLVTPTPDGARFFACGR